MEEINYEKLLPGRPAEDVVSFACKESSTFQKNYLIYRSERVYEPLEDRMKDSALVICTACGEKFHADKIEAEGCARNCSSAPFGWFNTPEKVSVISGSHTICPCCGQKAEAVHVGSMRIYKGELVDDVWVSVLARVPVEGKLDRLALLDWCVRRCIDKQGQIRYEVWPYTAWVVEEKKIVRLMGYRKCLSSLSLLGHWEQRKQFVDSYARAGLIMPWSKRLLEGTTAENSKLDLYLREKGHYPVSYLALWRKRPAVENLLMQGCGKLVDKWIGDEVDSYYASKGIPKLEQVNWKEKRPAQMLGLTKEEFRQMRRGKWNADTLAIYKMVRDAGIPARLPGAGEARPQGSGGAAREPGDMELLKAVEPYACNQILKEAPKADFWRILRYLKKQKADWSTLRDYWRMAREDGRDLEEGLVRFPRDLAASHKRQIDERNERWRRRQAEERAEREARQAKEMAERAELFKKRLAVLEKFSFQLDGLLIRPCADEKELKAEGSALHHCVGSYAASHAKGETAIFFIRRTAKPKESYFTLEFDEKKLVVRQNRGLRNCGRTPEVEAFEKAWLEWVKKNVKKKARVRAA